MSTSNRIPVQPAVARWARESAGFSPAQAARALGVGVATLGRWEDGSLAPTIKQLRGAAARYHRPLAVLLLPEPPTDFAAMRDFRRLGDAGGMHWSAQLHAEFKRALSQREVLVELAEIAPDSVGALRPAPRLRVRRDVDAETAGRTLRDALRLDDSASTQWTLPHEALRAGLTAAEALGVIVMQTTRVPVQEMRGFSIAAWPFPVIALNGGDAPRGRLFTLLHELAHLAVSSGGLCDLHQARGHADRREDDMERYCNEAAAAALMPSRAFLADHTVRAMDGGHRWRLDELQEVSRRFGPSPEAVLLRLVALERTSWTLYRQIKAEIDEANALAAARERERRRSAHGGPSFYVVHVRDLGRSYVDAVLDAFYAKSISSLDTADYLDIRFDQLPKLERALSA